MSGSFSIGRWVLLLLAFAALGFGGCASTSPESDNASARPWNAPQGWENSLPGAMYDRNR
jgi:hypothetical protein